MSWTRLDALDADDPTLNEDVADAVRAVRSLLAADPPLFVDAGAVRVHANPDYRAAFFSIPHSRDAFTIELRHGDGYTYLRSRIGDYDGYVDDDLFPEFVRAALHGRLIRAARLRGAIEIESTWRFRASDGTQHTLGTNYAWRSIWRRWLPFSERSRHVTFNFNRSPPISHLPAGHDAA